MTPADSTDPELATLIRYLSEPRTLEQIMAECNLSLVKAVTLIYKIESLVTRLHRAGEPVRYWIEP